MKGDSDMTNRVVTPQQIVDQLWRSMQADAERFGLTAAEKAALGLILAQRINPELCPLPEAIETNGERHLTEDLVQSLADKIGMDRPPAAPEVG